MEEECGEREQEKQTSEKEEEEEEAQRPLCGKTGSLSAGKFFLFWKISLHMTKNRF